MKKTTKLKVLIVEDNKTHKKQIEQIFNLLLSQAVIIFTASTIEKAEKITKINLPDVLLTDYNLLYTKDNRLTVSGDDVIRMAQKYVPNIKTIGTSSLGTNPFKLTNTFIDKMDFFKGIEEYINKHLKINNQTF